MLCTIQSHLLVSWRLPRAIAFGTSGINELNQLSYLSSCWQMDDTYMYICKCPLQFENTHCFLGDHYLTHGQVHVHVWCSSHYGSPFCQLSGISHYMYTCTLGSEVFPHGMVMASHSWPPDNMPTAKNMASKEICLGSPHPQHTLERTTVSSLLLNPIAHVQHKCISPRTNTQCFLTEQKTIIETCYHYRDPDVRTRTCTGVQYMYAQYLCYTHIDMYMYSEYLLWGHWMWHEQLQRPWKLNTQKCFIM